MRNEALRAIDYNLAIIREKVGTDLRIYETNLEDVQDESIVESLDAIKRGFGFAISFSLLSRLSWLLTSRSIGYDHKSGIIHHYIFFGVICSAIAVN